MLVLVVVVKKKVRKREGGRERSIETEGTFHCLRIVLNNCRCSLPRAKVFVSRKLEEEEENQQDIKIKMSRGKESRTRRE